jgi:hypothetical protein
MSPIVGSSSKGEYTLDAVAGEISQNGDEVVVVVGNTNDGLIGVSLSFFNEADPDEYNYAHSKEYSISRETYKLALEKGKRVYDFMCGHQGSLREAYEEAVTKFNLQREY